MKPFLRAFLLLSFLFHLANENSFANKTIDSSSVIKLNADKPVLYHASFKVLKYKFTGLVVFKYLPEKNETRIVFLAEAGLSIAEFSYKHNAVECLQVMPMVDRNSAKNYLARIIELLLTEGKCSKERIKNENDITTRICKGNKGKHYYIYNQNTLESIEYKKGLWKKAKATLDANSRATNVVISKRNKPMVKLKIVENAIK